LKILVPLAAPLKFEGAYGHPLKILVPLARH
jgi:hypothetical protein